MTQEIWAYGETGQELDTRVLRRQISRFPVPVAGGRGAHDVGMRDRCWRMRRSAMLSAE